MILTGKANIDYHNWLDKNKRALRKSYLDDTCEHAIIIEWFDSVGVIIEIVATYYDGWTFMPVVYDTFGNKHDIDIDFNERQEATKQAILKANEIYNELPR